MGHWIVVFNAQAAVEYAEQVKSKSERKAIAAAIKKLEEMGEQLAPPHIKRLQRASGLCELRPRRGDSDWRLVYRRVGPGYVVFALGRHDEFSSLVARASARAGDHLRHDWKGDKP